MPIFIEPIPRIQVSYLCPYNRNIIVLSLKYESLKISHLYKITNALAKFKQIQEICQYVKLIMVFSGYRPKSITILPVAMRVNVIVRASSSIELLVTHFTIFMIF